MPKRKASKQGEIIWISPNELHFEMKYQRLLEQKRLDHVINGMREYGGYNPIFPIEANQNYGVTKGQHRWVAAQTLNIPLIPVVVKYYQSVEDEAKSYADDEKHSTKQQPIDHWHTQFIANDPLAQMIYRLESDENSLFCGKIALRGKNTTTTKFKITDVLLILNVSINKTVDNYRIRIQDTLRKTIQEVEYQTILQETNQFLFWFVSSFGEKPQNKTMYIQTSLRAAATFYLLVCEKGLMKTQFQKVINKMNSFNANQLFKESPLSGRVQLLVNHFNYNRTQKTRIHYVT